MLGAPRQGEKVALQGPVVLQLSQFLPCGPLVPLPWGQSPPQGLPGSLLTLNLSWRQWPHGACPRVSGQSCDSRGGSLTVREPRTRVVRPEKFKTL